MRMNLGLQLFGIRRSLARAGIDPETFDTAAHIDRSLRYHENVRNIMGMHGKGRRQRDYSQEQEEERHRQRKARKNKLRQTGVSNEVYDRRYAAKHPGKRRSRSDRRYYERRSNRSDISRQLRL